MHAKTGQLATLIISLGAAVTLCVSGCGGGTGLNVIDGFHTVDTSAGVESTGTPDIPYTPSPIQPSYATAIFAVDMGDGANQLSDDINHAVICSYDKDGSEIYEADLVLGFPNSHGTLTIDDDSANLQCQMLPTNTNALLFSYYNADNKFLGCSICGGELDSSSTQTYNIHLTLKPGTDTLAAGANLSVKAADSDLVVGDNTVMSAHLSVPIVVNGAKQNVLMNVSTHDEMTFESNHSEILKQDDKLPNNFISQGPGTATITGTFGEQISGHADVKVSEE